MAPVLGSSQPNRAKKTVDPNAPKRPVSSYALWLKDSREKLKSELASAKSGQHYAAFASERWNNLPMEERKPYERMGRQDAARYQKELDEYKLTNDYLNFQEGKVERRKEKRREASGGLPLQPSKKSEKQPSKKSEQQPLKKSEQQDDVLEAYRRRQSLMSQKCSSVSVVKPMVSVPSQTKVEGQVKAESRSKLEQIGRLEVEKAQAVAEEEFERAAVLKRRISALKRDLGEAALVATKEAVERGATASAAKSELSRPSYGCTASVVQQPPPKARRIDTEQSESDTSELSHELVKASGAEVCQGTQLVRSEYEEEYERCIALARTTIMRSAAAHASQSLHRLPDVYHEAIKKHVQQMPVAKPVEIIEPPVIVLDPPIFDRWWVKRRSLFAARLHADAGDAEIEAEARRCWDLLTDDLRRTYDLPLRVASAPHVDEDVVEPGPPGFGRWLGLSGRRRKKIRTQAMFLPLYSSDGSWVPYAERKRAVALRLWGNVSDKKRAKYAKRR